MANEFILEVHKRELGNKNFTNKMRKGSQIPGIYYSHDSKESIPLYILESDLNKAKKASTQIFSINVGNKKRNVLFKSVQYHPVTDKIMHIDLYGIKMDQIVSVNVSIKLMGEPIGVSQDGGILVQGLNEIEIDCLPIDIPEFIEVDISNLSLGDAVRAGDIDIDEKLILKTDPNQVLASITQAMKEEEIVVDTEEELEEGEEGAEETGEEGDDTRSEEGGSDDSKENKTE